MKAHQMFQEMPPDLADNIFGYLRDNERDAYKSVLASLAGQRKLRPVFVQRKPVEQQMRWLHDTLKLKPCDELGEHLLQVWLLKSQTPMLVQFLDDVGIQHDGDGNVEDDLPDEFKAGSLKKAVDALLAKHPAPVVRLYLHVFQLQRAGGWNELQEILDSEERFAAGETA